MKTLVCLPTKNEAQSIESMIKRIKALGFKPFVIDENSKDGTIEIAKKNKVKVYQRDGLGKGFGVRKALQVAKKHGYDILVLIDCDTTYPPEEIPKLLKHIPKYDMVVGVRPLSKIKLLHRLPNLFHTMLINLLYNGHLKDINSGLRAIKISKMPMLSAQGFDIEAQMSIRALKKGLKIKEIPINFRRKRKGKEKIRIKDGFVILWRIIKEKF